MLLGRLSRTKRDSLHNKYLQAEVNGNLENFKNKNNCELLTLRKISPPLSLSSFQTGTATLEISVENSQKIKIDILYEPYTSPLSMCTKNDSTSYTTITCSGNGHNLNGLQLVKV